MNWSILSFKSGIYLFNGKFTSIINLTHDFGIVSEWISLAKALRTFVARTLPSHNYFTRELSFWTSSSRPLATVTYLSRNLKSGSVNEF